MSDSTSTATATTETTTVATETPATVAPLAVALTTTEPVAAATEPAATTDTATGAVEYEQTGDAGLDYALNFVGKLGFGPTSPAIQAAQTGDFSLLQAQLATLGPKAAGYEDVLALAKAAFSTAQEKAKSSAAELSKWAAAAAGGPERWNEVQAWASKAADPAEKAQINAALAAGGVQAKMALDYLVKCFNASSVSTKEPAKVVGDNATANSAPSTGPLTAKEYAAAVHELARKANGRDISSNPEYQQLQARRLAARRQGK